MDIPTNLSARSPGSIQADSGGGPIQQVLLPKATRDLVISIILAFSILMNCALYWQYHRVEQETDLKRYDLDFFKENDWAALKAQVQLQGELIRSYGLQKAVKDSAKGN